MKTNLLMTAVAFLGFNAFAADCASTNATTMAKTDSNCPSGCCCAPQVAQDGTIQAAGTEWLNVDTITVEAANGNPIAQYAIAYLTSDGSDTPMKDDPALSQAMAAKAMPALQKAAAEGHKGACMALAHMHHTGSCGCDKNPAEAQKYVKMAQSCEGKPCTTTTTTPCTENKTH